MAVMELLQTYERNSNSSDMDGENWRRTSCLQPKNKKGVENYPKVPGEGVNSSKRGHILGLSVLKPGIHVCKDTFAGQ